MEMTEEQTQRTEYKALNRCFRQIQGIPYTFCLFNTMFDLETLGLGLDPIQSM